MNRCLAILVGALGLALAHTAGAQACPRPLTVAMTSLQPSRADAPLERAADALLDELAQRSGVQWTRTDMPRMRAVTEFKAGRIDVLPMASRSDERDAWGRLLPLGRVKPLLILPRRSPITPQQVQDLTAFDLPLTLVRGQQFGSRFDAWAEGLARAGKIHIVSDQGTAVRMMKAGRSAGALGLPAVYESALQQAQWSGEVQMLDLNLGDPVDIGMYLSAATPESCIEPLRRAADQMRRSGAYLALLERFLSPRMRQGLLP